MALRALWAALRRRFSSPQLAAKTNLKKLPQLRYPELVVSIVHDTGLPPEQVRRICDCLLDRFSMLIELDQAFTSPVLSFKVITRLDNRRFARVVRRLPPSR